MVSSEELNNQSQSVNELFIPENAKNVTLEIHSDNPDENSYSGHSWLEVNFVDETGQEVTKTIGTYPDGSELFIDRELNENRQSDFSRVTELDENQLAGLNAAVEQYQDLGRDAWEPLEPCSYFASDVWQQVTQEDLEDRNLLGISLPSTLSDSIQEANERENEGILQSFQSETEIDELNNSETLYELEENPVSGEVIEEEDDVENLFAPTEETISENVDGFYGNSLTEKDVNLEK